MPLAIFAATALGQIGGGRVTVVNSATFDSTPLAPLTLATAFGDFRGAAEAMAGAVPLPMTLGNLQVQVNGDPAPLLYVSSSQANFVVPARAAIGTAEFVITVAGNRVAAGSVGIEQANPLLFVGSFEAARPGIVVNADGTLNSQSNPAQSGTVAAAYATGLGVQANTPLGAMVSLQPVEARAVEGGFPGIWRVQFQVPSGLEGLVPLAIFGNGLESNAVGLWVR